MVIPRFVVTEERSGRVLGVRGVAGGFRTQTGDCALGAAAREQAAAPRRGACRQREHNR